MPLSLLKRIGAFCLPVLAGACANLGYLFFKVSNSSVCRVFYEAALYLDAKNYRALVGKGVIELQAESTMNAVLYFKDATAVQPKRPQAYKGLGDAYRQIKNYEKAELYYKKALEKKGDYLPGKLTLAFTYIESKQFEAAKALLDECDSKKAVIQKLQGIIYIEQQQYDKALDVFQALFQKYPAQIEYASLLGSIYYAQGRLDEGVQYFKQYCRKRPVFDVLFSIAAAYDLKGQREEALVIYQKALEVEPDSELVLYRLGLEANVKKDYIRAKNLFETQIRLRPDSQISINAFYSLALAEMRLENFAEAIYWFEKCIVEDNSRIDAYQWLIEIYEKLGDEVSTARYKKLLDEDWYGRQ